MHTKADPNPRRIVVLSLSKKRGKRRREFVPPRVPQGQAARAIQRACGIPIAIGRSVLTRLKQRQSPTQIAADVGLHRSTIYRIKNGRKGPQGKIKRHWIHAEVAKGSGRCPGCGAMLIVKQCLKCRDEAAKRPA